MRSDEEEFFVGDGDDADGAGVRRTFRREEMTACTRCGRPSPPTRMNCLYCGAELSAPHAGEDLRRPALKPPEDGERGFNVVLIPREVAEDETRGVAERRRVGEDSRATLSGDALAQAASLLRVKPEQLSEMMAARVPLPLARTGERAEVALVERRLAELGLSFEVVADDDLAVETTPPRRVRRIELGADEIAGWGGAGVEAWRAAWDALYLIVAGRVYRKRIEIEERIKRGAAGEMTDARELAEDEAVVDLHFAGERAGWRIVSEGFDYSCLGARKRLLAAQNFARLVETLREQAPRAAFDDSYRRVRHLLQFAWAPEEHTESGGLRHTAPGRFRTGAVTSVTNETQFTRYSRLLSLRAETGQR